MYCCDCKDTVAWDKVRLKFDLVENIPGQVALVERAEIMKAACRQFRFRIKAHKEIRDPSVSHTHP